MGSTIPSLSLYCKTFTIPTPSSSDKAKRALSLNTNLPRSDYNPFRVQSNKASHKGNGSYKREHRVVVACSAKDWGPGEEQRATETVLKLYDAIKNRNVYELSDIIAEECLCISNFVSTFQPFHGKRQVLGFLSSLMTNLGNHIQFVVQNTLEDGMVVVVSWKLEWKDVPLPLANGLSFYMCHVYRGKVMIKNLEIFIEPLLHIEPLRLKIISMMMNAMETLHSQALFKDKASTARNILFILLFIAAAMFSLRNWASK